MAGSLRIHHVTLMVDDLERARRFYLDELGLTEPERKDVDYPGAFLVINDRQQLHLAEFPDHPPSYRGHCCLRVSPLLPLYQRMRELGVLDVSPWGRIRRLPNGSYQCYVRDPAGNLVELTSEPGEEIDPRVFGDLWLDRPYRSGRNEN